MFDMDPRTVLRGGAEMLPVLRRIVKCSPIPALVVAVGHQFDFIRRRAWSAVGIHEIQQLVLVVLAMDKGDEQPARPVPQYVRKNARGEIVAELFTHCLLA